jgi:archaemetzincin
MVFVLPFFANYKSEEKGTIYLVSVGKVAQELLIYLANQLGSQFPYEVKIGKSFPQASYAYNKRRNQYCSDLVLRELETLDLRKIKKILGLVDLDLYTPGLNFVFGQASIGGKACLVALPRLRQGFYGLKENRSLFYERALKEAVHELGHSFGLDHCRNRKCVMHFSNCLADTDYKEKQFCETCKKKLPWGG